MQQFMSDRQQGSSAQSERLACGSLSGQNAAPSGGVLTSYMAQRWLRLICAAPALLKVEQQTCTCSKQL